MQGIRFERVSEEEYIKALKANGYNPNKCLAIDEIPLPKRATKGSAGYDIVSPVDIYLHLDKERYPDKTYGLSSYQYYTRPPKTFMIIPLGIRVHMPNGIVFVKVPRSGQGIKYGINLLNSMSVIDEDFYFSDNEGHIMLAIRFNGGINNERKFSLKKGERICQGLFLPYFTTEDDDADGIRNGGLGSTGTK